MQNKRIIFSILSCVLCLIVFMATKHYLSREIVSIKYRSIMDVHIIDLYFKNMSKSYIITSANEGWDNDLRNECFVVSPDTEFKGTIVINKVLGDRILFHVADVSSGTATTLPYFYSASPISIISESISSIASAKYLKDEQNIYSIQWSDAQKNHLGTLTIKLRSLKNSTDSKLSE